MNSNFNHTPGPWRIDPKEYGAAIRNVRNDPEKVVLIGYLYDTDINLDFKANCSLIEIAPDMAEAIMKFNLAHDITMGGVEHPPTNEELEVFSQIIKKLTQP